MFSLSELRPSHKEPINTHYFIPSTGQSALSSTPIFLLLHPIAIQPGLCFPLSNNVCQIVRHTQLGYNQPTTGLQVALNDSSVIKISPKVCHFGRIKIASICQ